jgi:hypothetical protein
VCSEPALWRVFSAAVASDEWYFSTCLSVLGLINLDALKAEERQRQEAQRRMELYGIKPRAGSATAPLAAADTSTGMGPVAAFLMFMFFFLSYFRLGICCVPFGSLAPAADVPPLARPVQPVTRVPGVQSCNGARGGCRRLPVCAQV